MQQVQYINGNLMGALSTAVLVQGDTTPRDGGAWFDIEPSLQGSLVVKAHIKNQGLGDCAGQEWYRRNGVLHHQRYHQS